MTEKVIPVAACGNFCGEAPIWSREEGKLYWVDTGEKVCHVYHGKEKVSYALPVTGLPQALGFRRKGGWVCPMEDRVVLLDKQFRVEKDLGSPLGAESPLVLGDGTCGPDGCYYFGAYDPENLESREGGVYRLNRDGSFEGVLSGLALPNGMAFNDHGDAFYLTEMFARRIWRFRFNEVTGSFSEKSLFAEIPEDQGYPDGLIVDKEGCVWSAHWQGFRISRYDGKGGLSESIPMPVPTATSMAFGDRGTLYITTARKGCTDEQLASYGESGTLFALQTATKGRSERCFIEDR